MLTTVINHSRRVYFMIQLLSSTRRFCNVVAAPPSWNACRVVESISMFLHNKYAMIFLIPFSEIPKVGLG